MHDYSCKVLLYTQKKQKIYILEEDKLLINSAKHWSKQKILYLLPLYNIQIIKMK